MGESRESRAPACSMQRVTASACCRQNVPFSTPFRPESLTRASARIIAVRGLSQPRTRDHCSAGSRNGQWARPCGSNTAAGPRDVHAARVTARLSGRVEVVTTAPGASRIIGITTLWPFPERGGPSSSIESSTDAQHPTPRLVPTRYPRSAGRGRCREGRSVFDRATRARAPAAWRTSPRRASPSARTGEVVALAPTSKRQSRQPATTTKPATPSATAVQNQ